MMLACLSGPTVSVGPHMGASWIFSLSLFLSLLSLGLFSPGKVLLHSSLERKNKQTGYPQECKCYFGHIRNICVCGFRWLRGLSPHDKCPLFVFPHDQYLRLHCLALTHQHTHTRIYIHVDLKAFPRWSTNRRSARRTCHVSWRQRSDTVCRVCGGGSIAWENGPKIWPRPARGPTITG